MPSSWFYPTIVSQIAEDQSHIAWDPVNSFLFLRFADENYTRTVKSLIHIANSRSASIKNKTWYLLLTGFNFTNLPANIQGLEAEIHMNREGRITDDTIQLRYNNNWIGENRATNDLEMFKFYGGSTDNWGTNFSDINLQDSSFGIGIRFQSHPLYPHNSTPMLDYIRLRVY